MADTTVTIPRPASRRRSGVAALNSGTAFGVGIATLWLSLLVLIPLGAVVWRGQRDGVPSFWDAITTPQAAAAIRLTVVCAVLVAVVNAVLGTLIAWVLVRDQFRGKWLLDALIDLPFALPTIVAGLVLLTLYGAHSPVGLELAYTRAGVVVALLFVTLPFVVRSVQPVLLELDVEMEHAAASLGAGNFTIFRRIVFPNLLPAISAGTALSFARAISEFGATVLIAGNLPVASVHIYTQIETDNTVGAAAVATVLLLIALSVLVSLEVLQRWAARHA
ncbi:MAG TPA: sulfate ABC transporter permease subunit CysT [Ilumatobacteraceae bacterium]|nr:sulfate ABC transporter permease subunit CysT [Ilumatobacteraceae bacterium]